MKAWSKGLGKVILHMDARRYYVELEDDKLLVKGKILDPVLWKLILTVEKDDLPGIMHVALKPGIFFFILKNFHMVFVFLYEKIFKREKFVPAE